VTCSTGTRYLRGNGLCLHAIILELRASSGSITLTNHLCWQNLWWKTVGWVSCYSEKLQIKICCFHPLCLWRTYIHLFTTYIRPFHQTKYSNLLRLNEFLWSNGGALCVLVAYSRKSRCLHNFLYNVKNDVYYVQIRYYICTLSQWLLNYGSWGMAHEVVHGKSTW